jgi:hypothetical protein
VNSHVVIESCIVIYCYNILLKWPKLEILVAKFLSTTINPPTVYYHGFLDAISFSLSHYFVFGMLHPCVAAPLYFVNLVHIIAFNP